MAEDNAGTTQVTDHRVKPRGVLPRATQTWIMAGLAFLILGIIVFAGRPDPAQRPVAPVSAAGLAPSPERLRDYQDRLRVLDARAQQQALDARELPPVSRYQEPTGASGPDPLEAEKSRREYESLFASNVVLSRRPEGQRLAADREQGFAGMRPATRGAIDADMPTAPSLDEVAEAVIRASSRQGQPTTMPTATTVSASSGATPDRRMRPAFTGPINGAAPVHRILEGTVIDAVLMNRVDGSNAAPVNCLVTNPVYSHGGQHVVIPAGTRVIGETKPVEAVGETRLAVTFHRLVLPDGRTYSIDQVTGLNQVGDAGLRDQVNHHYWSTFGAAGAVGLISGLTQFLGTGAFGGDGDRTVVIAGGVGTAASQATGQTMNRFLNRLPTITIREGHRVKVYLTADLELPAFEPGGAAPGLRAAEMLAGVRR